LQGLSSPHARARLRPGRPARVPDPAGGPWRLPHTYHGVRPHRGGWTLTRTPDSTHERRPTTPGRLRPGPAPRPATRAPSRASSARTIH